MRLLLALLFIVAVSDVIAADLDNDGIEDSWELAYGLNPENPNDAGLDIDKDGLTALQEANSCGSNPNLRDTDGDWIADGAECNQFGTDPTKPDTDGDGYSDLIEAWHGLDPLDSTDAGSDTDNDGLTLAQETIDCDSDPTKADTDGDWLKDKYECLIFGTNPRSADTDNDGVTDYVELLNGYDPLDSADIDGYADADGDGLSAATELAVGSDINNPDTDGDLLSDFYEVTYRLKPQDANDADSDFDGDSFTNYEEYRLGSLPNDPGSVPDILPGDYSESFENGLPALWFTTPNDTGIAWTTTCDVYAPPDGACALRADSGAASSIRFMARFPKGKLSYSLALMTGNNFTVTADGQEIFAATGYSLWTTREIDISAGVHEIVFRLDHSAGGWSAGMIDTLKFVEADPELVRPQNQTCLAPPVSDGDPAVAVEYPFQVIPSFELATKLLQAPSDPSRWFVLEQAGLLKVFDVADPANVRTYLDFTGDITTTQEAGLLGMAFDPNFPAVPEVYVVYVNAANYTTLSRIVLDDTDAPVSPVEQVILQLQKDTYTGHYGGDIAFGPDGMLYMSIGDYPGYTLWAQDTKNLYGSMIRIDVRGVPWPSPGYSIPDGNAFPAINPKCGPTSVNSADCPEIFAWGFRNPWRWSFDSVTGDIWLSDVGDNSWEEVNRIQVGGNYGWPCFEGRYPGGLSASCGGNTGSMIPPVADFSHAEGRAAVGGLVYRGSAMPDLYGRYIFGDLGAGSIWELIPNGTGGYTKHEIARTPTTTPSYAADAFGEIYFVTYYSPSWNPGGYIPPRIGKLVPAGDGELSTGPDVADNLADTGCFDPADPRIPAEGLIPYDVNAKLWSDGALKARFMALPDGTTIDINEADDWNFPVGSVLVKNFFLQNKIIETRLLMNRFDTALGAGKWYGYTYEWDEAETAATRVVGGKTKDIGGQTWTYPSEAQCSACHTDVAGATLGPETAQLNGSFHYPSIDWSLNQLAALNGIGMFSSPLTTPPELLPQLVDTKDTTQSLNDRARSYFHSNCSQCHQPGSGVPTDFDLRYTASLGDMNICDVPPSKGDLGLGPDARLIAPGDSANSVILNRMGRRDAAQMPPIGSHYVDSDGLQMMTDWVNSLQSCQ